MKKNMAFADRVIRISIAALFAALYFSTIVTGIWAYVMLAIGAVFLLTSLISVCPLYSLLGISICRLKNKTV